MGLDLGSGLWERFRRTLGFGGEGVRKPSEADYLVKMNLPSLLGRRDAACEHLAGLLDRKLFAMEIGARRESCRRMLDLLEYALADTEAVAMMLSSAETSAREQRLHDFLGTMEDLLLGALGLTQAQERLQTKDSKISYFLSSGGKMSRSGVAAGNAADAALELAVDLYEDAQDKLRLYRDYNRKSFSTANAQRYRLAFDDFASSYLELDRSPVPPR